MSTQNARRGRRCAICRQAKPASAFYASQKGNWCKPCKIAWNKAYKKTARGAAVQKAARDKYRKSDKWKAVMRDYQQRERLKHKARCLVWVAIQKGELKRGPCRACGATEDIHAHHEDYTKPLEVDWLCRGCHNLRHAS